MTRSLRIVMVGETIDGSRTPQRRAALQRLGHGVAMVSTNPEGRRYEDRPGLIERLRYRLRLPGDPAGANAGLLRAVAAGADLVWVENARMIRAATLKAARAAAPDLRLIWYSEDDTLNPRHRTRWMDAAIPLFDLWVTTKSFNARPDEVPALGARRVLFVHNSFDPTFHRPLEIDADAASTWGADVSFVGTFEEPRARSMLTLAEAGIPVRIWGNGWGDWAGRHPNLRVENRPVYGDDYIRVCRASRINLCFLRKFNRDLQTCRSVEIPACEAFMMHERNAEISGLFAEGREAVYFDDDAELVRRCRDWLNDDAGRHAVARAARRAAVEGGHSHDQRLARIIETGVATA